MLRLTGQYSRLTSARPWTALGQAGNMSFTDRMAYLEQSMGDSLEKHAQAEMVESSEISNNPPLRPESPDKSYLSCVDCRIIKQAPVGGQELAATAAKVGDHADKHGKVAVNTGLVCLLMYTRARSSFGRSRH